MEVEIPSGNYVFTGVAGAMNGKYIGGGRQVWIEDDVVNGGSIDWAHFEEPKYNNLWEDFFYGEPVNGIRPEITRTKAEVLQKLNEARALYTRTIDQ